MAQISVAFKASYKVQNLFLNVGAAWVLRHEVPGLSVLLAETGDGDGDSMDVMQTIDISTKRLDMLRLLEQGQLPAGSTPDPADARVSAEGTFTTGEILKLDYLPNSLQNLYHEVRAVIHDGANRTLRVLRWRLRRWISFKLIGVPGLYWEGADGTFKRFPSYLPAPKNPRVQMSISPAEVESAFESFKFRDYDDEPIGHRLLQNAHALCKTDPRAAILVAISAVEIAVKDCISKKVPDAEWIAFNAPMPPVTKILGEYVPTLFDDSGKVQEVFTKDVIDTFMKHNELRNRVAHRGSEVSPEMARTCCHDLCDLLRRLDFVMGNTWALEENPYDIHVLNSSTKPRE